MNKIKFYVIPLMVFILSFSSVCTCYATDFSYGGGGGHTRYNGTPYKNWSLKDKANYWGVNIAELVACCGGIVFADSEKIDLLNELYRFALADDLVKKGEYDDLQDFLENYIVSNVDVDDDGNYNISNDLTVLLSNYVQDKKADYNTGYYVYPSNLDKLYKHEYTTKSSWVSKTREFVRAHNDVNHLCTFFDCNSYHYWKGMCEGQQEVGYFQFLVFDITGLVNSYHGSGSCSFKPYNDLGYASCEVFRWNSEQEEWVSCGIQNVNEYIYASDSLGSNVWTSYFWVSDDFSPRWVWNNVDDYKNSLLGTVPYYNVDPNSLCKNIYYSQNATYTYNNIDNSVTITYPDYPSGSGDGGGSGSGSGSGGGSGGGSDDGGGFWSDLGNGLKNLISGIFDAVGGALVGAVEGLTKVFATITGAMPSIFSEFIGAFFGWLPEEIQALLIISLTCMVLYGLIKMIRG